MKKLTKGSIIIYTNFLHKNRSVHFFARPSSSSVEEYTKIT